MIIATRLLTLRNGGHISISIHAPEKSDVDWICRFEIGWPREKEERWAAGVDSVQALLLALQMIGVKLYTSEQHRAGELTWLSPDGGYGFPVSQNTRDLLVGDDKRFL
jgi:hypothetical protein